MRWIYGLYFSKKKKLKFAPLTEVIEDEIEICKRFSDMCKIIN